MSTTHINRLRCSISNTPGTSGNVVVGAATSAARRTFTAAEDGKSFEPTFEDGNNWEVRTGCVYTHSTATLTRGTLVDSSTGSAIALTSAAIVGLHGTAKAMQELDSSRAVQASGDTTGAVDDVAIAAAITAAGSGGTIRLVPGATYYTRDGWTLGANQTLEMNGATVKRAAQTTTTTATSLTSGATTSFVVASATGLAIGDTVAAVNGFQYSAPATISNIAGTTVTVSSPLAVGSASTTSVANVINGVVDGSWTLVGTTTIAKIYNTINAINAACVRNGVIDGTRASWTVGCKWDLLSELLTGDTEVCNVEIKEAPGEALTQSAASAAAIRVSATDVGIRRGKRIHGCRIHDCNGNGIHLSGVDHTIIDGNSGYNINEDLGVGHIGGFVTFSYGGDHVRVVNNNVRRAYALAGPMQIDSESRVLIQGNVAQQMQRYGLHGASTSPYKSSDLQVIGNLFSDCGNISFTGQTAGLLSRCIFSDNVLIGTQLLVQRVSGFVASGNVSDASGLGYLPTTAMPTTITGAITANSTTSFVVGSGSSIQVGMRVHAAKAGTISSVVVVSSVAGTTVGVTPAFDVSLAAGATLYVADSQNYAHLSAHVTTGDSTFTTTDCSRFFKNQWVTVYNSSADNSTTALRISAIDYSTGIVTVDGTMDKTHTAGTSTAYSNWAPPQGAHWYINACDPLITNNQVIGGSVGIQTVSDCSDAVISNNRVSKVRYYSIMTSSNSSSMEMVFGNTITLNTNYASSVAYGIWVRGKQRIVNNVVKSDTAVSYGIISEGTNAVLDGNEIRLTSGSAMVLAAASATNLVKNTKSSGSITNSGTGNTVEAVQSVAY